MTYKSGLISHLAFLNNPTAISSLTNPPIKGLLCFLRPKLKISLNSASNEIVT